MTDAEIDALKAGVELDKMIAESIGMQYAGFCRRGPVYRFDINSIYADDYECGVSFRPSSDWNDAMWVLTAITKARKLCRWEVNGVDGGIDVVLGAVDEERTAPGGFGLPPMKYVVKKHGVRVEDSTSGPVAICRAILKAVKK